MSDANGNRATREPWYKRHSTALVVFAAVLFIVAAQWPMVKGIFYRATGTSTKNNIAWRTDLAAALTEARESGRPLLVDFTADWCPPCQVMKQDVWPDKDVETLANRSYIPVLIDVDTNQSAAMKYNVSSIPTISVLHPNGEEIARSGFMSRSAMVRFLNQHADSIKAVEEAPETENDENEATPASAELVAMR